MSAKVQAAECISAMLALWRPIWSKALWRPIWSKSNLAGVTCYIPIPKGTQLFWVLHYIAKTQMRFGEWEQWGRK